MMAVLLPIPQDCIHPRNFATFQVPWRFWTKFAAPTPPSMNTIHDTDIFINYSTCQRICEISCSTLTIQVSLCTRPTIGEVVVHRYYISEWQTIVINCITCWEITHKLFSSTSSRVQRTGWAILLNIRVQYLLRPIAALDSVGVLRQLLGGPAEKSRCPTEWRDDGFTLFDGHVGKKFIMTIVALMYYTIWPEAESISF